MDLNYVLPCDVKLEPATTIKKGCTLSTLLAALKVRESPDWERFAGDEGEWAYRYRKAIHDLNNMTDKGEIRPSVPNGERTDV
ncbi:hypothetical protein AYJ54_00850 [Bradyrhizobium centrolobii]|uniref:Uncharacterized protein n=1 Tax=Bradyrhizobium centrolobii TaxID=1505087 RepID=A0A176YGQ3_9BRAD|nr:hypothetical protein [Bradyrhizobium centrolobii]OAF05487.1 hypothetical protein AYJ54_00850 [Bradyrhizobium centrolobii]